MFKKANQKLGSTSLATLLISTGINMHLMKTELSAASLAIWAGVLILISLSLVQLFERLEKDLGKRM
jgi:hypothetical protein